MSKAVTAAFACALCMSLGLAPLFMGTFPLLLQPVSSELSWGAAVYPQAALVAGTAGALIGPAMGHLIDRFGVRPLMLLGLTGWAATLIGLSFMTGSRAQMLIVAVAMGITSAACGPIAFAKVVAGWFDRQRGLVLGIVLGAAPAVSTAILVMLANALIPAYGWRVTYQVFAAAVVCLALPVAVLFMHEAPTAVRNGSAGPGDLAPDESPRQALSSRKFWFVLALTGLTCGVVQSLVAHFVAFSAELGVGVAAAAMALSAFSLAGPIGPLLAGAVADRTRSPKPLLMFYALPAAGLLLFQSCGAPAAIPSMVLMGMGFQAATGMLPYLLTRYFGVRHASQLFGWGLGVVTLAMGAGPVILGYVRDRVQAFGPAAPGLLLFLAVALALLLTLPSYHLTASAEPRPKNEGPVASP